MKIPSDQMLTKKLLNDLAIFGSPPSFTEALHVGQPNLGNRRQLFRRINDLLDRKWLTNNGFYVREFERQIAGLLAVKHCIATCSGTMALEIAIQAMELSGEVIVPSFTFVATAHVLKWRGIKPVFCDVQPETHNIDPYSVERMLTARTTGIIGVHLWGRPCDIERLSQIAARNHLKVLFDAAQAFGCSYKARSIGNFGEAEIFSFHATKLVHAFEGGAILTNNDDLAERARLMRNFGFAGYDQVICVGTNGKMSEISAAMGITTLESMNQFIEINYRHYKQYQNELKDIPGVSLISYNENEKCNYQHIVLEIDETATRISRDFLIKIFHPENVLARRYFFPGCHRLAPYHASDPELSLPATEKLSQQVLCLPTGSALTSEQISEVCQILRMAVAHGTELSDFLSGKTAGFIRE